MNVNPNPQFEQLVESEVGKREETSFKSSLNGFWKKNQVKITDTATNVFAFLASPIIYATTFTAGFLLNAFAAESANKITKFIQRSWHNTPVVTTIVGLLAIGFVPARWVFAGAHAFDMGREAHRKLSEAYQTIGSKNSNLEEVE